jgi:hypothetical protein
MTREELQVVREPIRWFATKMESELRANDHKGGWSDCNIWWLLSRLREEVDELEVAMHMATAGDIGWDEVIAESADVANFAMMIADRVRVRGGDTA